MTIIKTSLIVITFAFVACSENATDNKPSAKNGHLWQAQTESLQEAKDLATKLNEEFKKKEQQIRDSQ